MKRPLRTVLLLLGLLVVVAGVAAAYFIGPRNIWGMLRYDQRREGSLEVGDGAPDVELVALDGKRLRLLDHVGAKPLVLIFGSYT